jgi:putative oxidoreductase
VPDYFFNNFQGDPMFDKYQNQLTLLARVLMAILFLVAGIGKIGGFAGTAGYIASKGLPLPQLGAVIAIVVEVGGAVALLAGFQTRVVALVMAVFTIATGVFFHNFWALPAEMVQLNQIMFMKNLSIAGGLLMMSAFGAGALSLDAKRKS